MQHNMEYLILGHRRRLCQMPTISGINTPESRLLRHQTMLSPFDSKENTSTVGRWFVAGDSQPSLRQPRRGILFPSHVNSTLLGKGTPESEYPKKFVPRQERFRAEERVHDPENGGARQTRTSLAGPSRASEGRRFPWDIGVSTFHPRTCGNCNKREAPRVPILDFRSKVRRKK